MRATLSRSRSGTGTPPPRDPQRRLLLAIGLVVSAFLIFLPARQLVDQHVRMQRLEERLDALNAENRLLEAEVRRLSDPEQLELQARERLGLVKPGERAYVLIPDASPSPPPAPVRDGDPWWSRAWSWLVDLLRGDG